MLVWVFFRISCNYATISSFPIVIHGFCFVLVRFGRWFCLISITIPLPCSQFAKHGYGVSPLMAMGEAWF